MRAMAGFEKNRFVDITDHELTEFTCGLCLKVFNQPMFTSSCCLQTYCKQCITEYLEGHQSCPNDMLSLSVEELRPPPLFVVNILENLRIKCDHFDKGCQTVVELKNLGHHLKVCSFGDTCHSCGQHKSSVLPHFHFEHQDSGFEGDIKQMEEEIGKLRVENKMLRSISQQNLAIIGEYTDEIVVIDSKMNDKMSSFAKRIGIEAQSKFTEMKEMCEWIEKQFNKQYDKYWHSLVSGTDIWASSLHSHHKYYISLRVGGTRLFIWKCR